MEKLIDERRWDGDDKLTQRHSAGKSRVGVGDGLAADIT